MGFLSQHFFLCRTNEQRGTAWKGGHAHDPGTLARTERTDGSGRGTLGRYDIHRLSEGGGARASPSFSQDHGGDPHRHAQGQRRHEGLGHLNRAIQEILNNLKGVFFPDDDMEHMAFAVIGCWTAGDGYTTIRISDFGKWWQVERSIEPFPMDL